MSGKWEGAKSHGGHMLRCKCGNKAFLVVKQPVARKVRSKSSHRKRIVGVCPGCTKITRIKLGGPN